MNTWTKTHLTPKTLWKRVGHGAMATGLTVFLLLFLVFARWLDAQRAPDQIIRMVELAPPVVLAAPPPPPQQESEAQDDAPPPPPQVDLPHLELQIEAIAPPLVARLDPQIDLSMQDAIFDVEIDPVMAPAPKPTQQVSRPPVSKPEASSRTPAPKPQAKPAPAMRSTYDAGELDARPHLINRPSASYPRSQQRAGVKEGKVLLEVSISTTGRASVRRVISSTNDDFSVMARQFASRARFSVPKKNGRAVTAIYRWPLILRP